MRVPNLLDERLTKDVPIFLECYFYEGERHEARRPEIQHHHYRLAILRRVFPEITGVEIGGTEKSTVGRYISFKVDVQVSQDLT